MLGQKIQDLWEFVYTWLLRGVIAADHVYVNFFLERTDWS